MRVKVLKYGFIGALVIYALLPFYWMVITAVKPLEELSKSPPTWFPQGFDWSNVTGIWTSVPFDVYLFNSVLVGILTTLIAVPLATGAAYAFFRFRFRFNGPLLAVVLFSITVPAVIVLVPFYDILSELGLLDTRTGLVLSYVVWSLPFVLLLMRGYFQSSYPLEVEEAALIDGCSRRSVLWRVVLPLSIPGIAVSAVFVILLAWNEYLWASVVAGAEPIRTASVGLQSFLGQFADVRVLGQWMAGAVFLTLPLFFGAVFLQRYIAGAYGPSRS